MQSCAVIGCGPAGIMASTCLRQSGFLVTCFELHSTCGGMWAIDSQEKFSSRGLLSPLFPSMRCIIPKDLMAFSDARFDYTVPHFSHHSSVKHYLERYGSAKGVAALTRFNTKVQSARFDEREKLWKLITVNIISGDILEWSFDKVCVCTGQTQEPRFPKDLKTSLQPYMEAGGEVEHACFVKDFRALRGKKVVLLGDGVSAAEYSAGLYEIGADVYHSTTAFSKFDDNIPASSFIKGKKWKKWPSKAFQNLIDRRVTHPLVKRLGALKGCDGKGLLFEEAPFPPLQGGRIAKRTPDEIYVDDVDLLLCATGYTQRYPFLHADIRRVVEEEATPLLVSSERGTSPTEEGSAFPSPSRNTRGLYLGTIFRSNPSLAFVGLPKHLMPPFLLYEVQSKFVSYAMSQRVTLPPTELEMLAREQQLEASHHHHAANIPPGGEELFASQAYFNLLQQELGISSRDTFRRRLSQRSRWVLTTLGLRVYHKFRSWAPLKRKQQHLLFSNKI